MIIDVHTHIVPPDVVRRRERYFEREPWFRLLYEHPKARLTTAEELIAEMDRAGVDRAVTFGFAWRDEGLLRQNNDYVIDAVRRYPDRLIGFAVVNPAMGSLAAQEAERCAHAGLRGVGELMPDGQGYALDDEQAMGDLVDVLEQYNLILLSHASEPVGHMYPGKGKVTPDTVVRFVERHPDLLLILAHWGGGLWFYELMPELLYLLRNVYYDTAASPFLYRDKIYHLAMELIPHKVLWGSDYPLMDQVDFLQRLRWSRLPEGFSQALLGGNAARLLGIVPSPVGETIEREGGMTR